MKVILTALLIVCLSVLQLKTYGQGFDSAMAYYAANFLPEKAYIHFDKSSYYPGQTIWFKTYVQEDGLPATTKTLYTDWIGEDGKVLHHSVSPMVDGVTNGQFDVPEDYAGKFIQVKAYTRWMLNFDSSFLYSRDIRILPSASAGAKPVKPVINTTVQFFPEGGDLISGVMNKIAFKATDQWGRPVKIKGIIADNKGNKIDSLRVIHNGMGYSMFIPEEGMNYTARWKDEKGAEQSTRLPLSKQSGVVMQVTLSKQKRIISLQASNPLPQNLQQVHIVGTINQKMAFKTSVSLAENGSARRVIPTDNLITGVMTITLFDASWNAIAERITFINNNDYQFTSKLEVKHWGLSKRGRNELEISLPDNTSPANLSIAVTDAAIDVDSSENIYSGLLLTNDIKGYVHNPAYYFTNTSDTIQQHLDLVMLTNGWRRFQWEQMVRGKMPVIQFPKDTTYLSLSGTLYGISKGMLSGKESIVLLVKSKDSGTNTLVVPINPNGTFSDPGFVFFDTLRVYYQLRSKVFSTAEARFMTERLPAPNYLSASRSFINRRSYLDTMGYYRHFLLANEAFKIQQQENGKLLANVTVRAKAKTPEQTMNDKYAKGLFSGGDAMNFDLVNDRSAVGMMNIFNYLQGRVAGLQINSTSNPPSLTWRGGAPQLYLDEMPIDANFLASLPINDVAFVKVFRPPFIGPGGGGGSGAIAIYTRRGDDMRNAPGTGLSTSMVMGYTTIREFYTPNYSRFDPKNDQRDIRTTLYWNPGVVVTKGKPAKITFYNNDVTKAFRVIITGMSKDGLLTYQQEIME